ncbi:Sua5/YciO/YrdC/YwlC family protein [Psychromonas antarctica]|jgi:L-threonylcarbamoyladenylate synthase|uniref:Sua5/YciO/YrdC/YwlC family protein n=1 Tax=Psychromonas antarctica TaxID=67573 RepID=UPI001EE88102|nr:Sua5/YciO/YrdC/YwlC family protein [Psychromonas antarctica]MCG6200723.1 Sua5/YciO/YrdC/YwlC family protein [Psychromonas antarctica]
MNNIDLSHALSALNTQGVIAYPTESVFGLGCDPDCDRAIVNLLKLKKRPVHKGLILIAANINQLDNYVDLSSLNDNQFATIQKTWPGPVTWVVPANKNLSALISGDFSSVAVRVTAHPTVQQLCLAFAKPIISTSANLSGFAPCVNSRQVADMFANQPLLTTIVDAPVSGSPTPSQIYDALSGKRLR